MRLRPWSAILRVQTADGVVWFKESAPSVAFEPALTEFLARRRPDCTAHVVAVDGPRFLTRDAGPQLRTLLDEGAPVPAWDSIVKLYAELQMELTDHVGALIELGVPDTRPERLDQTLAGPLSATLIHEELHEGNVCVREGEPVFIDWAEASISHPFAGLVNTLRMFADREGLDAGAPEILGLRDAYLERWTPFASLPELRELFERGYAFGALVRAETWERALLSLAPAEREGFEHYPGAWRTIHTDIVSGALRLGG